MKLVEALPRGKSLELATGSGSDAEASFGRLLERTAARGTLRSGGKLVQVPAAHATIEAPFRDGLRTVVSVPAPGVATAYHSAGVENVVTYAAAPRATIRAMRALRPIVSALRSRPARWLTSALLERVDDSDAEPAAREQLWGRLVSEDGRVAEGTLTMPHGPTLTAAIAVEASQRAATGRTSPGAYTPAMAFGAGFITEFSGCDLRVPRSA
ncbi:MAG: hypothetical protein H5U40_19070 [Polyangiaceae bacterium]|nr:hypothetical protein [Polyangiaceae bacterium]